MGGRSVTLADLGRDDSVLDRVARGLQVVLAGLVGYGAVIGDTTLLVNGVLALAVTLVPPLLRWRYDHKVDPRLDVWIAVAALAHAVGFLGLYGIESGLLAWYDQMAHAISASFVAGVGYALIVAFDRRSAQVNFPAEFRFVFTFFGILAFGVVWEIVEFAVGGLTSMLAGKAVLVQYGIDDIVFDLVFNALAGALVALWGTGYFSDIIAIFSRRFRRTGSP